MSPQCGPVLTLWTMISLIGPRVICSLRLCHAAAAAEVAAAEVEEEEKEAAAAARTTTSQVCSVAYWTWLQRRNCISQCSSSLQLVGIIDATSPCVGLQADHTDDFRPLNNRPPGVSTSSMYGPWWPLDHNWATRDLQPPALPYSSSSRSSMRRGSSSSRSRRKRGGRSSSSSSSSNNNNNKKSGLQRSLLDLVTKKKLHTTVFVFLTISWDCRPNKPIRTSGTHWRLSPTE